MDGWMKYMKRWIHVAIDGWTDGRTEAKMFGVVSLLQALSGLSFLLVTMCLCTGASCTCKVSGKVVDRVSRGPMIWVPQL